VERGVDAKLSKYTMWSPSSLAKLVYNYNNGAPSITIVYYTDNNVGV